jgi:hypothetical protein
MQVDRFNLSVWPAGAPLVNHEVEDQRGHKLSVDFVRLPYQQ